MIRRSSGLLASGKSLFPSKSWNFVSRTSWSSFSDTLSVHKYEAENDENTPFEFTAENMEKIKKIISKYPPNYQASAVIPVLDLAQRQHGGWTPVAAMRKIAKILGMKEIDVFEVASFYTMFNRTPIGRYHVQVCGTTPCDIRGAQGILKACEEQLGVKCGHSTPDRKFHLTEVECLGACVNAPMIQINDEYYEDLTPETTKKVLKDIAEGRTPKPGPQDGKRRNSIGPQGRTTLKASPQGPSAPNLDKPVAPPTPPPK